jgi:aromatic-L-amino-acid decarboxylase
MHIDEFRKWARRAADWSADYLASVAKRRVRATTDPGEILGALPLSPPVDGEAMERIFADFERIVLPGMTHWQHPRFFAYFPANSSPPSVVAEYLTATLAAQCMLWQTSPAATELETRMLEWLRQMIALPDSFQGCIQDSASSATLAAILTGREKALAWQGNTEGLAGSAPVRVYCSEHVHSSVERAVRIAGIGTDNLVRVATGRDRDGADPHAMDTNALEQAILDDRNAGLVPAVLVSSVGGTSVGGSDRLAEVGAVARRHGLYHHVDAAWAGSAMICPEFRPMIDGVELADSFVFNPHKWLFTNFDCTAHFLKDPDDLVRTLAINPAYLATEGREGVIDYSQWSVPLGRRFRALKLWFVIRAYGTETLQAMIRSHVAWAQELAELIRAEPDFEIVTEPVLSLFTFRYLPDGAGDLNALNAALLAAINDDGRIYLTQTHHRDVYAIRFQVGQTYTTRDDVMLAFEVITELAARL